MDYPEFHSKIEDSHVIPRVWFSGPSPATTLPFRPTPSKGALGIGRYGQLLFLTRDKQRRILLNIPQDKVGDSGKSISMPSSHGVTLSPLSNLQEVVLWRKGDIIRKSMSHQAAIASQRFEGTTSLGEVRTPSQLSDNCRQ